ncbi:MAG: AmmeMemoRadiSam system radical SAM enzyme [Syntrophales bacterium]|nr:AmmeMemoRadiSam system radical SAM enzyme [Syntrophales bacterium]
MQAVLRLTPILGGLGSTLSPVLWNIISRMSPDGLAFAADIRTDLLHQAPAGRYWTSFPKAHGNCRSCHQPDENIAGKNHNHDVNMVKCLLCAQGCTIRAGERGKCRSRMNVGGQLKSLVYGRPVAIHTDPIEKKPFYHFLPRSAAFSFATTGCPLSCRFCQNWEISQASPEDFTPPYVPPSSMVLAARNNRAPVIAFTYNEPTVFFEYMVDVARAARKQRLRSVLISCGFMNEAPLIELCDTLDAIKIDLKGFSSAFYRDVCHADLRPVLKTIKTIARRRIHLEIVNLVVPTLNDSEKMIRELVDWISGEIGPDVPIHFTRFHPDYQLLNLPPTPVATLEHARNIAMDKGIRYAYVGNVPNHPGNHTYCPSCKKVVIKRLSGFFIEALNIKDGRCSFCHSKIAGVWM